MKVTATTTIPNYTTPNVVLSNNLKQEPGLMKSTIAPTTTFVNTPAIQPVQVPTPILQPAVSIQGLKTNIPISRPVKISSNRAPVIRAPVGHPAATVTRTVKPTAAAPPKSKKKKAIVAMATAQSATSSNQGENTGRWTADEHRLFLQGLEQHGKGWKKIASLIKSRTVVQIRTHAQKYFQKLAKARQNGEEGEVSMENRERVVSTSTSRRRKHGTKRKAISSVVNSAEKARKKAAQEKKKGAANGAAVPTSQEAILLTSVAPALTPFVNPIGMASNTNQVPAPSAGMNTNSNVSTSTDGHVTPTESTGVGHGTIPSITTAYGTISGAALEESLFRFLTPMPNESQHVNDVARQAGANPITLPSENKSSHQPLGGEISPTVVVDFPSNWAWTNDAPMWYSKGADVDELLNEAEALDWLADSGDLNETYNPPIPSHPQLSEPSLMSLVEPTVEKVKTVVVPLTVPNPAAPPTLPVIDSSPAGTGVISHSSSGENMPPLQSLFESGTNINGMKKEKSMNLSSTSLFASASEAADAAVDDNFNLLDAQFDEQAFVTALLDQNSSDSASNLNHLTQ